jgi:hypothetical protein
MAAITINVMSVQAVFFKTDTNRFSVRSIHSAISKCLLSGERAVKENNGFIDQILK